MIAAVTGARGMIGWHLIQSLRAKGFEVRALSRKGQPCSDDITLIQGDINDRKALLQLLDGVTSIFHCAAELNDEAIMFNVNVKGTQTLLESMRKTPTIQYFCHMSSAGVVGPTSDLIVDEKTSCKPNNAYEKSKYEAEQLVLNANLAMNVCILRPTNVFDVTKPSILNYAMKGSFKDKVSVFIKGHEGAHLVHAKDVAEAALFFMDKTFKKPNVFFVSYDDDIRNTVLGAYNVCVSKQGSEKLKLPFALPSFIPYFIRKIKQGKSLHGRVRFSEKKLRDAGFIFPLGLEKAVSDVCSKGASER
ncbi:MAG: NAD-dependent epimerase/dehydratase family protein [Mariprofundaceae bacterium]|nr:NAD-dependent epimerase/dehydratase family protein [Mariprofundaceae bacterium]